MEVLGSELPELAQACENVRTQRKRRIVFSIALVSTVFANILFFQTVEIGKNFPSQISISEFSHRLGPLRQFAAARHDGCS
jgi:hypothetical protein